MDIMALSLKIEEIGAAAVRDALERLGITARDTAQDLDRVDRSNDKVADSTERVARAAKKGGEDFGIFTKVITHAKEELAGLAAGFGAVMVIQKFIGETSSATIAQAQLAAVLKSTQGASGQTVDSLNEHAGALARLTAFEDDAITSAQVLLLSFNKIADDTFPRATQAVLDLATLMAAGSGGVPDLKSAAVQVGKALQDPILGVTALSRAGVQFSEAQRETIKQLVEQNRLYDAQTIVLEELRVQTGGQAEALRETFGGAVQGLMNDVNNLFELSDVNASNAALSINNLRDAIRGLQVMLTDSRLSNAMSNLIDFMSKAVAMLPMVQVLRGGMAAAAAAGREEEPEAAAPPLPVRRTVPLVQPPRVPPSEAEAGEFGSDAEFDKWFADYQERQRIMARDALALRNIANTTREPARVPPLDFTLTDAQRSAMAKQIGDSMNTVERIVDRSTADAMLNVRQTFAQGFGNALGAGIAAGFDVALSTKSIGQGFRALTGTVLSSFGGMLVQFGTEALVASGAIQKMFSFLFTPGPQSAVAAAAIIAIGASLQAAGRGILSGGGNRSNVSVPTAGTSMGMVGSGAPGALPGISYFPTTAGGMGSRVAAATPVNVTVIGPNDPSAQRAIQELIINANRRGSVFAV
jgi:hypothetical protein